MRAFLGSLLVVAACASMPERALAEPIADDVEQPAKRLTPIEAAAEEYVLAAAAEAAEPPKPAAGDFAAAVQNPIATATAYTAEPMAKE
jgi:hypothetical protein